MIIGVFMLAGITVSEAPKIEFALSNEKSTVLYALFASAHGTLFADPETRKTPSVAVVKIKRKDRNVPVALGNPGLLLVPTAPP